MLKKGDWTREIFARKIGRGKIRVDFWHKRVFGNFATVFRKFGTLTAKI
jgi:hypothetical protein